MSCTNKYEHLIDLFVQEALNEAELLELRSHLTRCEACRYELAAHVWLERQLPVPDDKIFELDTLHIQPKVLARYLRQGNTLSTHTYDRIADHVKECAVCQKRIEILQQAATLYKNSPFAQSSPETETTKVTRLFGLVAASVILLLLYPAYIGIRQIVYPDKSVIASQSLVDKVVTARPLRLVLSDDRGVSESKLPSIVISDKDIFSALLIPIPISESADYMYDLSVINSATGVSVVSLADIHSFDDEGNILLLLLNKQFQVGKYAVVVEERKQYDPAYYITFTYPFAVVSGK